MPKNVESLACLDSIITTCSNWGRELHHRGMQHDLFTCEFEDHLHSTDTVRDTRNQVGDFEDLSACILRSLEVSVCNMILKPSSTLAFMDKRLKYSSAPTFPAK